MPKLKNNHPVVLVLMPHDVETSTPNLSTPNASKDAELESTVVLLVAPQMNFKTTINTGTFQSIVHQTNAEAQGLLSCFGYVRFPTATFPERFTTSHSAGRMIENTLSTLPKQRSRYQIQLKYSEVRCSNCDLLT